MLHEMVPAIEQRFGRGGAGHRGLSQELRPVSRWAAAACHSIKSAVLDPPVAPRGNFADAADYRCKFPDGRIGSDPSQASVAAGEKIVAAAVKGVISEFKQFAAS